jgi:cell division protease FtsH
LKSNSKTIIIILTLLSLLTIYQFTISNNKFFKEDVFVSYSNFLKDVQEQKVNKVVLNNNLLKASIKDGKVYKVVYPINDSELIKILKSNNVEISVLNPEENSTGGVLTILLVVGFIFLVFKMLRKKDDSGDTSSNNQSGPFSFGKSKARLITPEEGKITFEDVAGVDEAKEELIEIVEFLKDSKKFTKLGAKIPKGCLLVGSPGTGKTLLARAVAGEAGVPFFSISGSDFVEMFVGVGASRVRDLFNQAKKKAPCIVFIDEIDAVGRQRGVGIGGGNDEREQTLNQLLVEMDGFSINSGIIVLAATNRSDVLDNALLRPGRFDRQVVVPLPDLLGREKILQIYLSKIPAGKDININTIARGTTGFSGADIANLVNEAAIFAAKTNKDFVDMIDFEHARDKILMGAERKSTKMTEEDRKLTAYHEAGHALVSFKVDGYYPVHKVTIIPRGRSLGVTSFIPEKDEYNKSYKQLVANLAVLFGGRVAEELIFGKENITTGASMDIQMATSIANKMVKEWGFSDKLGRIKYTNSDYVSYREASDITMSEIENQVRLFVENGENTARLVLIENKVALENLALALLEYETLSGEEAKRVCNGELLKNIRENKSNEGLLSDLDNSINEVKDKKSEFENDLFPNIDFKN